MNHKNQFTCPFSGGSILIIEAVARVSCKYARWLVTRVNQERSAPQVCTTRFSTRLTA